MGCIYKITNTVNGKVYIGKSVDDSAYLRIYKHFNGQGSRLVYAAIKKYGKNALTYEILHDGIIPELIDSFEIEVIKSYNAVTPHGYNLTSGGEGGIITEEARRNMSKSQRTSPRVIEGRKKRAEKIKGRPPWNKGIKMSDEQKKKLSIAHTGKKLSIEHCCKLSKANKGNKNALGHKQSAETLQKKYEALKGNKNALGHKPSKEANQKRSEALKGNKNALGHKPSKESNRKRSEALKGERNHNFGKPKSAETCRKISESLKGNIPHNKSPYRIPARQFFFSLPSDMSLKDKRRLLHQKIGNVHKDTLNRWIREWVNTKSDPYPHNKRPEFDIAQTFYSSLPSDMSLEEKRKCLRQRFPNIPRPTVHRWCRKFDSVDY